MFLIPNCQNLYFYKCAHFLLFLSLSTVLIHQFHSYTKILTLIPLIPTLNSPHSHSDSPHSHPYRPHSHPDSLHSHHSHPDSPHSHHSPHSVPGFPISACDKTRINSQTEYRVNTPVLNTIFTAAIYKNKFQIFFFKCHVFVTKGFSADIYTLSPEKSRSMYKIWSSYC